MFLGVQREISTGALPWAERTDVVMIADGTRGCEEKYNGILVVKK